MLQMWNTKQLFEKEDDITEFMWNNVQNEEMHNICFAVLALRLDFQKLCVLF